MKSDESESRPSLTFTVVVVLVATTIAFVVRKPIAAMIVPERHEWFFAIKAVVGLLFLLALFGLVWLISRIKSES
jgi:hypothetical protein